MAERRSASQRKPLKYLDPGYALFDEIHYKQKNIDKQVMIDLLDLAIEIAREGREGRKIGTMFVIGDEKRVQRHSRCLILDPLYGHPRSKKSLSDPNLRETIKELAQLDGGFIVSADGVVLSATRYFDASAKGLELLLGLGSRHIAAASITRQTASIAVVVSESAVVRVFSGGDLIAEVLPEVWLISHFSTHIKRPRFVEHPQENIAVVSSEEDR